MLSPYLSLVIPVCNEEGNLEILIQEIVATLRPLQKVFEVIFVDDASTDKSKLLLAKFCREYPEVKVIYFRRNYGQTAAFDAGFKLAKGEIVITLDSDLQNDPRDIPMLVHHIEKGYDFVAGWRRKRKDGFLLRTIPSKIANALIRRVTQTHIKDLGCSLKAYKKQFASQLRLYGEMHRFIGVLIEGMGAKVANVEVNHRERHSGVSKYNLKRTFKVVLDLVTVWFLQGFRTKPSYIFGGVGGFLFASSFLISLYVLYQKYFLQVWVHKNPLFMIAIFFSLVGVQFIGLGLIAELMVRTYFEASEQTPYWIEETLEGTSPTIYREPARIEN